MISKRFFTFEASREMWFATSEESTSFDAFAVSDEVVVTEAFVVPQSCWP